MTTSKATPLVSVLVLAYQHVEFISMCLDGILMQETNFDFEIILGEDESSDGTRAICQEYAKNHPDVIRLFLRSRDDVIYVDGGPSGKFNFLESFKSSNGKYIAVCEGDDYWTDPLKLQKQIDFLEENEDYNICFHDVKVIKNNKLEDDAQIKKVAETTTVNDLITGNFIRTPSIVFRSQINLPDWLVEEPVLVDFALNILNASKGKIKKIDGAMAVYRVHDNSSWSSKSARYRLNRTLQTYNVLANHFADDPLLKEALLAQSRIAELGIKQLGSSHGMTEYGTKTKEQLSEEKTDEQCFQDNLNSMQSTNRHLADWIREVNDQHLYKHYEVSDRIARRQGLSLHDETDPEGEAKQLAQTWLKQHDSQGPLKIMGLGLGYHVEALLDLMNMDQKCQIQLLDRVVFQLAIRKRDMTKIFSDKRVSFVADLTPETSFVLPGFVKPTEPAKVSQPQPLRNSHNKNDMMGSFCRFLKSNDFNPKHIVDVGANHGTWTREILRYFPDASYTLFEPQGWLQKSFQDLLDNFPKISFNAVGAGSKEGSFEFAIADRDDSCSFAYADAEERGFKQIQVPVVTLNKFFKDSKVSCPDIIKIDAEGWDIEVLKGASDFFGKTEVFMVEVGVSCKKIENSLLNVINFMNDNGYRFFEVTELNRPWKSQALWLMEVVFVKKDGHLDSRSYRDT